MIWGSRAVHAVVLYFGAILFGLVMALLGGPSVLLLQEVWALTLAQSIIATVGAGLAVTMILLLLWWGVTVLAVWCLKIVAPDA